MAHLYSGSMFVAVVPEDLYDLISDIGRTGEWSPICTGCEWDEGHGPRVGARFTGHNRTPDREWSTRSTVMAASRGVEFGWVVNDGWARWHYSLEPAEGGTVLTESWEFTDAGLAGFADRYGDGAEEQVQLRIQAAQEGIPATLAAIKKVAERG